MKDYNKINKNKIGYISVSMRDAKPGDWSVSAKINGVIQKVTAQEANDEEGWFSCYWRDDSGVPDYNIQGRYYTDVYITYIGSDAILLRKFGGLDSTSEVASGVADTFNDSCATITELQKVSNNLNTEEAKLPLFDTAELRNFLEKCKDADISAKNKKCKEAFESLRKIFPNLRLQGSWIKGQNKYFFGNAPVIVASYSTGPQAIFIEGPAKGCSFSTAEELGSLLRCYKGLNLHILGDLK